MENNANLLPYAELSIALDVAKAEYRQAHRDWSVIGPRLLKQLSAAADRFIALQKQLDIETNK